MAGTVEGISHTLQLGTTTRTKDLVIWAAQTWNGCKTQAQPSLCFCGVPENLNLSGLDLGRACKPGPASDSSRQSNIEPEQCRLGKHTGRKRGQTPLWPNHCEHTPGIFVRGVPPSPQQDWTREPKKSDHHRPLVSGRRLDTEETSKQKQLK